MTTSIHGQPDILGVPLLKARNLLRAWMRSDLEASASYVGLPLPDALAIASELARQGFLHPEGPGDARDRDDPLLTTRGLSLAAATTRRRAPRTRAEETLSRVVERALLANADPDRLHDIREIWVFGSTATGSGSVGDVDVAVDAVPSARMTALQAAGIAALREAARSVLPASIARTAKADDIPGLVLERTLHGGRPDPLLSICDVELLVAMHVPCRKAMDAHGRTTGQPLLPYHPASTGRGPGFMERRELHVPTTPDLPVGLSMRGLDRYAWRWSPVYEARSLPESEMRSHALFRSASLAGAGSLFEPGSLHGLETGPEDYVVARLSSSNGLSYAPVGTIGHENLFGEGSASIRFSTRIDRHFTRGETVSCARHVALASAATLRYARMCRPDVDWTLNVSAEDPGASACLEEAEALAARLPGWLEHGPDGGASPGGRKASSEVVWETSPPAPTP